MINKDTILSVYTDKQTLLEYLTKIETALDKAVLTSSQLVYEGGNNYHFKFVFEDGSSIETPSITLVQPISKVDFLANGNSVHFVFTLMDGEMITTQTINLLKPVTAAAVRDGILYLTLSDGTEVSAGSITASFGATTFNGEVIVHGNFHQTDGTSILGGNTEIDGNLQVNGNQTEVGNLDLDGILNVKKFTLDESLGITLPQDAINNGFSVTYQRVRESNNELNVVIVIACTHPSAVQSIYFGDWSVHIPEATGAKLYPTYETVLVSVSKDSCLIGDNGWVASNATQDQFVTCTIFKPDNTTLRIKLIDNLTKADTEHNFIWRFEFNFLLS